MTFNQYDTLSSNQYHAGFEASKKNSAELFEAAKLIATTEKYGLATSLLILSAEEFGKAAILKIKSNDPAFIIPNMDDFFKAHSPKHKAYGAAGLIAVVYKLLEVYKEGGIFVIAGIMIALSAGRPANLKKELNKINDKKNDGLYVKYLFEDQKWHYPSHSVTKEEFERSRDAIKTINDLVSQVLHGDKIPIEDIQDAINEFYSSGAK